MPRKAEPASITEKAIFPTRLRTLMKERDITQKQLADVVAMRPQTISLYVQGQSAPDINCLKKIAEYFSVSADWLLGLSDAKSIDGDIKAACKVTGLSEAAIKIVQYFNDREESRPYYFSSSHFLSRFLERADIFPAMRYIFRAAYYHTNSLYSSSNLIKEKGPDNQSDAEKEFLDLLEYKETLVRGDLLEHAGKIIIEGDEMADYTIFQAKEILREAVDQIYEEIVDDIESTVKNAASNLNGGDTNESSGTRP